MGRYLIRRTLEAGLLLPALLFLTFLLIHLAPGDPIVALAGEYGDEAYYGEMRARFGLDRPLGEQLLVYLGRVLRGDLGTSFVYGQPVLRVILSRLPPTLVLMGTALALSSLLGIALGLLAAYRRHSPLDAGLSTACLLGYGLPVFWSAQLLVLVLALHWPLFPVQGMTSARAHFTGWRAGLDVAWHMALPLAALVIHQLAITTRLTRSSALEVLGLGHVRTARAKGLAERRVLVRHVLRPALLPVITLLGGRVGSLLAGAVLTETVFAWPGLGRLLVTSSQARDLPLILGIFLFVSAAVVVANLLTDLVYVLVDPRIRYR